MKLAVWRGRGRHHPSFFFGLVFLFSQLVVKQQKNWAPLGLSSVVEEIRRWGHNLTWYVHSLSRGWFHFNLILFLLVPLGTSTRHEVLPWLPVTPSVLGSLMVMDPCCAWENHLPFLETLLGGTVRASQVVLVIKNPPADAGDEKDASSIPESGRSPRGGHGYPFQYFCRENLMDRGAWRACKESMGLQRVRQG